MYKNSTGVASAPLEEEGNIPPLVAAHVPSYGTGDESEPDPVRVMIDEDVASEEVPLVVTHDDDKDAIPQFRDVPFAVMFLIHATLMVWLGIFVAPKGYSKINIDFDMIEKEMRKGDDMSEQDIADFERFVAFVGKYAQVYPKRILLSFVFPTALLAFVIALFTTIYVVKPCPKTLTYASLVGSFAFTAIVMISSSVLNNSLFGAVMTIVALVAVAYYVCAAWRMVPFAAVNLKVALIGMSRNCGVYLVAFFAAELGFLWPIYWVYVLIGVSVDRNDKCEKAHPGANFDMSSDDFDDVCHPPPLVFLLFLLSLYWTSTVLLNTVQVSVAGVMATWCFDKRDADHCCSPAVFGSVYRSMTYSFGSICLGSLLQALISVFRYIVESARSQRERNDGGGACGNILLCILECFAKLLEDVIDYFNQWAYVFVGIYGYSYLESGRRVIELFRARGWTAIINDNLVGYVLGFTTVLIGVLTGATALLLEFTVSRSKLEANSEYESYIFGPIPGWRWWAFGIGFFVGIWVSSVVMNVVKAAVNTLVVCWADSPAVVEMNHPRLTSEMADSWLQVFPEANAQIRPAYNAIVV